MFKNQKVLETIIFDVDGVFTDGSFYYNSSGKVLKKFGAHDGDGIKFLRFLGLKVYSVTADQRGFDISKSRMSDLDIELKLVSEENRFKYVSNNFSLSKTAFMGDGIFDAKILSNVECGIATMNASRAAKTSAKFITKSSGGSGAVFEAAFLIGKQYFPDMFSEFVKRYDLNETDF
ncbi:HAD hydrolase family protein [Alphaproteobacteria bacterium]|nr:HAD hydrolase family protein [Alphaproteobacteria bacterium]